MEYLQTIHHKQEVDSRRNRQSFGAGFDECLKQVHHFMKCIPLTNASLDYNQLSEKLFTHLEFCRQELTHKEEDNLNTCDRQSEVTLIKSPGKIFSVIQHTRDYSSSISSASSVSSASSTRTVFSPPSSPEPTHRTLTSSTGSTPSDLVPDIRPLAISRMDDRAYSGYELGDDGVWRPW